MKKIIKYYIVMSSVLISNTFYAQNIGIGTTTPVSSLQVIGKPAVVSMPDGITAPNMSRDQLIAKTSAGTYNTSHTGTSVYVTDVSGITTAATANVVIAGYYYWDGLKWVQMGAQATVGVDVGYVVGWAANTIPPDYLLPISGGTYNKADYPHLMDMHAAHPIQFISSTTISTFTLMDINTSGRFLRGGNTVGVLQGDAIRNIAGNIWGISETFGSYGSADGIFLKTAGGAYNGTPDQIDWNEAGHINFDVSRLVPTASENRPVNISTKWCLKAKPTSTTGNITINNVTNGVQSISNNSASTASLSGNILNIPINSQAANGYLDIGNTRIQWGTKTNVTTTNAELLTFPQPFANTSYTLVGSTPVAKNTTIQVTLKTNSTAYVGIVDYTNNWNSGSYSWMAIGQKP